MGWWRAFRTLALVAALAGPAAAQEDPQPAGTLVEMGTGAITGAYFPVGVALCRLVNQHRPETGLRCSARPTEGSVANIAGLRDGSLELAIVQSDVQAQALAGDGAFAGKGVADLRSVMSLYPELLTLVARADAGIARVEDLAGKRVWIGAPGSGTRALADRLIAALGWSAGTFEDVPEIPANLLGQALCDGQIDAFLYTVGHPALVIQEATTACAAELIDVAGPAVDELVASAPYFLAGTIPGGLYRGTPRPVRTFGVGATVVTRAGVPEDTIYSVVEPIFADIDMLRGLDPVLANLDARAMATEGRAAPLHPGAARYYREQGWLD
jgi:TRAP transporter TAXI family solute receptor